MARSLGQVVYLFKDRPSSARKGTTCHTTRMSVRARKEDLAPLPVPARYQPPDEERFAAAFQARVKLARKGTGMSQAAMAAALGIKLDAYQKYENRGGSLMKHHLIARFCQITETEAEKLFRDPRAGR